MFPGNGDHAVDADQRDAVGKQKVAMSGVTRPERSARERRVGFGTPGMAALFNRARGLRVLVSRASGESAFVFPAMATTPLLLAVARAWHAGSGGAVRSTAALLDVAVRSPEL